MATVRTHAAFLLACAGLAACGGGGSGASTHDSCPTDGVLGDSTASRADAISTATLAKVLEQASVAPSDYWSEVPAVCVELSGAPTVTPLTYSGKGRRAWPRPPRRPITRRSPRTTSPCATSRPTTSRATAAARPP